MHRAGSNGRRDSKGNPGIFKVDQVLYQRLLELLLPNMEILYWRALEFWNETCPYDGKSR